MRLTTRSAVQRLNDANLIRSGDEFEVVDSIVHVGGDVEHETIVIPEAGIGQEHGIGRQFQQAFRAGVEPGSETAVGRFGHVVVAEDLELDEDLRRFDSALHGSYGCHAQVLKPAPDSSIFQGLREFAQLALLDYGVLEQGGAQIIQTGGLGYRHLNKHFVFGQYGHGVLQ
jgi:hypothetical protein